MSESSSPPPYLRTLPLYVLAGPEVSSGLWGDADPRGPFVPLFSDRGLMGLAAEVPKESTLGILAALHRAGVCRVAIDPDGQPGAGELSAVPLAAVIGRLGRGLG